MAAVSWGGEAAGLLGEVPWTKMRPYIGDALGALTVGMGWIICVAFVWHSPQRLFSLEETCQKSTHDLVNLLER